MVDVCVIEYGLIFSINLKKDVVIKWYFYDGMVINLVWINILIYVKIYIFIVIGLLICFFLSRYKKRVWRFFFYFGKFIFVYFYLIVVGGLLEML